MLITLYIDCCGGNKFEAAGLGLQPAPMRHLPFPGCIGDQPASVMDAFHVIRGEIAKMAADLNQQESNKGKADNG